MKKIENKALLKLGVVAMLLILGAALVEAMALNSVVTCVVPNTCTVSDPNGTAKITVWNTNTGVKMETLDLEKWSPKLFTFSVPPGNSTICLKDEEKPPAKDVWIVNTSTLPITVIGPMSGDGLCHPPKHDEKKDKKK